MPAGSVNQPIAQLSDWFEETLAKDWWRCRTEGEVNIQVKGAETTVIDQ